MLYWCCWCCINTGSASHLQCKSLSQQTDEQQQFSYACLITEFTSENVLDSTSKVEIIIMGIFMKINAYLKKCGLALGEMCVWRNFWKSCIHEVSADAGLPWMCHVQIVYGTCSMVSIHPSNILPTLDLNSVHSQGLININMEGEHANSCNMKNNQIYLVYFKQPFIMIMGNCRWRKKKTIPYKKVQ